MLQEIKAPAQASATTPVATPVATPAQIEQVALKVQKDKEDACALEVNQVLAKHGCSLSIGHQIKVGLITATRSN
jgi:hypothetical protein